MKGGGGAFNLASERGVGGRQQMMIFTHARTGHSAVGLPARISCTYCTGSRECDTSQ